MKTIAVIGSNGVLGADLIHELQKTNKVIPINRENYSLMRGISCDVLINANGNSKRFWANKNIIEDFEASTTSVYRSIFDFTHKQYFYISSSDVYKDHTSPNTTNEDQVLDPLVLSAYGFHKYLSETIVKKHVKNYFILRSSLILGKNLKKGPVYDLLHEKPLFISLDSKIQMITTTDIVKIINFLINNKVTNSIFNMGGEGAVSFKNIDKYILKKVLVSDKAEKQVYEMNIQKLKKIYPLKTTEQYLQDYVND